MLHFIPPSMWNLFWFYMPCSLIINISNIWNLVLFVSNLRYSRTSTISHVSIDPKMCGFIWLRHVTSMDCVQGLVAKNRANCHTVQWHNYLTETFICRFDTGLITCFIGCHVVLIMVNTAFSNETMKSLMKTEFYVLNNNNLAWFTLNYQWLRLICVFRIFTSVG